MNNLENTVKHMCVKTSDENFKKRLVDRIVEFTPYEGAPKIRTVITDVFISKRTINQNTTENTTDITMKFNLMFSLAGVKDLVSGSNVGLLIEVDGEMLTVDEFLKFQL